MSYLDAEEFAKINAALGRVEGAAKLRLTEDSKPSNRGPESAIWRRDPPELPPKEADDEMPSNGDDEASKVEWTDEDEDEGKAATPVSDPGDEHPVAKNIGRAAGGALGAELGPVGVAAGQYVGGKVAPHIANAVQNSPLGTLYSKIKEKFGDHPVAHAVGKMAGSMLQKHMASGNPPPEEDDEDAQPGMPNYDEQEENVKEPKVKNQIRANGVVEWRNQYERLISEMNVISGHVAKSGMLPTPGVHHDNKLAAGNKGLQGEPVQPVEPKKMDQEAGDNEYDTLDADLPEGCEQHFEEFLSERGLSVDLFTQLIDEATENESLEEMEQLMAVTRLFETWLKKHFPTVFGGNDDREERTKKAFKQGIAAMKANPTAVRKANAHGVAVPKQSSTGIARLKLKKKAVGEHRERLSFEADDDGGGSPSIDWQHLVKKYGKHCVPKRSGKDEIYGDETRPTGMAGVQGGGII